MILHIFKKYLITKHTKWRHFYISKCKKKKSHANLESVYSKITYHRCDIILKSLDFALFSSTWSKISKYILAIAMEWWKEKKMIPTD